MQFWAYLRSNGRQMTVNLQRLQCLIICFRIGTSISTANAAAWRQDLECERTPLAYCESGMSWLEVELLACTKALTGLSRFCFLIKPHHGEGSCTSRQGQSKSLKVMNLACCSNGSSTSKCLRVTGSFSIHFISLPLAIWQCEAVCHLCCTR